MKMRLGWNENELVFVEVAKRAQAVGVQALTLHARTAKQFYKGTPTGRRSPSSSARWTFRSSATATSAIRTKRCGACARAASTG